MRIWSVCLLISMLCASLLQGQTIKEEKVLENPNVPLKRMNVWGVNAMVKGTGGSAPEFLPSLEVADLHDDGFIVRKDFRFTKYNDAFEKKWESEIEKVYALGDLPDGYTIGNKHGTYFIQWSGKYFGIWAVHVTKFDSKGGFKQMEHAPRLKNGGVIADFVDDKGYHAMIYNKQSGKFVYTMLHIDVNDLSMKTETLPLEVTDEEHEFIYNQWEQVAEMKGKIVLAKNYFQEVEGTKKKVAIIKTVEVDADGAISNARSYAFGGTSDNNRYTIGNMVLDTLHGELYVVGGIAIESGLLNGVYISKYDYASGDEIFKREWSFDDFTKKIPDSSPRKQKLQSAFLSLFGFSDLVLEEDNQVLRLQLSGGRRVGTQDNNISEIKFDKYGDIIQVAGLEYPNGEFYDFRLVPEKYEVQWEAEERGHLQNMKKHYDDFLNSLTGKIDPAYVIWSVLPRKDHDILVYIKESNSEVKAYKVSY